MTVTEYLNLDPGIGQRQATFTFGLVEAGSNRPLGELHPVISSPPSLSHSTGRTITRTLTSLQLDKVDTAAVNPLTDRVTVAMIVQATPFPLGTYVFMDKSANRTTEGRRAGGSLADLGFVIAQKTDHTVSFSMSTNVGTAILTVLNEVADGLLGFQVEPTTTALGSPIAWPAGTDRGRILNDLCKLGGYLSPYMGNNSEIYVRQSFDPAATPATFEFAPDTTVINGTIIETDDLLDAPNRFIVIDNSNSSYPTVGVYDVPISAPHSIQNRGFVIADVSDIQGLGSTAAAERAARSTGIANTIYQRTTLSTVPDPRHDSYDICSYDDANWLEIGWSLQLREGSEMVHNLIKAYS